MEKISKQVIMKTVDQLQNEIRLHGEQVRDVIKRTEKLVQLISTELSVPVTYTTNHLSFNLPITGAKVDITLSHDTMYLDIPQFNTSRQLSVCTDRHAAHIFYGYLDEYNSFLSEQALIK